MEGRKEQGLQSKGGEEGNGEGMSRGDDGVVDEQGEARGEEVVRLSASSSEPLL